METTHYWINAQTEEIYSKETVWDTVNFRTINDETIIDEIINDEMTNNNIIEFKKNQEDEIRNVQRNKKPLIVSNLKLNTKVTLKSNRSIPSNISVKEMNVYNNSDNFTQKILQNSQQRQQFSTNKRKKYLFLNE